MLFALFVWHSLGKAVGNAEAGRALYALTHALQTDDMAAMIAWIAEQPRHININAIEVMPTSQTWAGFQLEDRE